MNLVNIDKEQGNRLLSKIKLDLAKGYKVIGNEANQVDIVRVWCRRYESPKTFAIVATSGLRFHNPTSFLELQSFGKGNNYKISFLLMEDKLVEATSTQTAKGEFYSLPEFVDEFLLALPDIDLTVNRLAAEGHNTKDFVKFM